MAINFRKTLILSSILMGAAFAPVYMNNANAQSSKFDASQIEDIEGIVKDYLMENPTLIMESLEAFRIQQEQEQKNQAQNAIKDNLAAMKSKDAPSIGASAEDAEVTVVEFFDYNCGYCKRAVPDIQAVLEKNDKVRFVFKEMPILGPTSKTAAQWALAAQKQDKYFEYHVALMDHRGAKNEAELSKLAESLGLDVEKMKKDANSEAIEKEIAEDVAFARTIGISGTPAFIVGETLYPGYLGKDGLMDSIKKASEDK